MEGRRRWAGREEGEQQLQDKQGESHEAAKDDWQAADREKKMMQEGKGEGNHDGKAVDRWAHLRGREHCPGCGLEPFVCGCIDMDFTGEQKKERRREQDARRQHMETRRQQDESESGTDRTPGSLGDEIGILNQWCRTREPTGAAWRTVELSVRHPKET